MRVFAVLLALAFPSVMIAQDADLPALYDVTGVAEDDVLNVRTDPIHTATKVGKLGPNSTGIEVVTWGDDRAWGKINIGEDSGWVSMAYMTRQPGQEAGEKLPVPMHCYGTEPFWSLDIREDRVTFTDPGNSADPLTMPRDPVGSLPSSPRGAFAAGDITGFVSREACNDGMSDRDFGWRVDYFRSGNGGSYPFSGCCTLQN